ncbi:hypothetical protein HMPREF1544_00665 [Mucor circinelloides 1006PhL]|uniref:EamA domain-containing protein n=1 Tax=Mucor circinelloides f. circinelloides (strain 1006PhL) TaxID=1220926 RepID=S2JVD6_MUCC1|nr:hypothetical protein HMPREF1544_00665 [Mucor circinelloides 1006PhL]
MSDLKDLSQKRYWGGILALGGVVFIWVSSSFAMNSLFGEMEYNKPFLVTYLNTATFSFYLIPLLFKKWRHARHSTQDIMASPTDENTNNVAANSISTTSHHKLSTYDTIKLSLEFCILWFIANYTTNASLAYTTVGSSTILASMSGLFTLGIGAIFKVEKMNLIKILAVFVSLIGVSLVSYSDHLSGGDDIIDKDPLLADQGRYLSSIPAPLIGDILALLGAIFYGCYTTLLKLRIGSEDRIDMSLFFGFVGAFNVLLLWPMIPILNYIGLETFQLPMNATLWVIILLNAFIGTFLSDYLWLLSMLMTSPLVVTLGISLTIPLALIGDIVFKGFMPGVKYSIGALLVVAGFLAVNTDAMQEAKEKTQDELLRVNEEV